MYNDEQDKMIISLLKGQKSWFKKYCRMRNVSMSEFIRYVLDELKVVPADNVPRILRHEVEDTASRVGSIFGKRFFRR